MRWGGSVTTRRDLGERGGGVDAASAAAATAFIRLLTPELMKDPAGRGPAEAVGAGEGVWGWGVVGELRG